MSLSVVNSLDNYSNKETVDIVSNIDFTKKSFKKPISISTETLNYINNIIDNENDNLLDTFNEKYPDINYQIINNIRYYLPSYKNNEINNICLEKLSNTKIAINIHKATVPTEFKDTLHEYLLNTIPYIICSKIIEWEEFILPILLGKIKDIETIHTLNEYDKIKTRNYWLSFFKKEYSENIFNYILNNYNRLKINILEKTDKKILKIIENIL